MSWCYCLLNLWCLIIIYVILFLLARTSNRF
nr:MAG TPA: hypothetical protein [Crassvirales sp.]